MSQCHKSYPCGDHYPMGILGAYLAEVYRNDRQDKTPSISSRERPLTLLLASTKNTLNGPKRR